MKTSFRLVLAVVAATSVGAGCKKTELECGPRHELRTETKGDEKTLYCVRDDGVWDGPLVEYDANGRIKSRATFQNGLREGLSEEFYSDGKLLARTMWKADESTQHWYFLPDGKETDLSAAAAAARRMQIGDEAYETEVARQEQQAAAFRKQSEERRAAAQARLASKLGVKDGADKGKVCAAAISALEAAKSAEAALALHAMASGASCEVKPSPCDYMKDELARDACRALDL